MSAALNFGQIILPITINAIGETKQNWSVPTTLMEYAPKHLTLPSRRLRAILPSKCIQAQGYYEQF